MNTEMRIKANEYGVEVVAKTMDIHMFLAISIAKLAGIIQDFKNLEFRRYPSKLIKFRIGIGDDKDYPGHLMAQSPGKYAWAILGPDVLSSMGLGGPKLTWAYKYVMEWLSNLPKADSIFAPIAFAHNPQMIGYKDNKVLERLAKIALFLVEGAIESAKKMASERELALELVNNSDSEYIFISEPVNAKAFMGLGNVKFIVRKVYNGAAEVQVVPYKDDEGDFISLLSRTLAAKDGCIDSDMDHHIHIFGNELFAKEAMEQVLKQLERAA